MVAALRQPIMLMLVMMLNRLLFRVLRFVGFRARSRVCTHLRDR